jgi:hypothetical protein
MAIEWYCYEIAIILNMHAMNLNLAFIMATWIGNKYLNVMYINVNL